MLKKLSLVALFLLSGIYYVTATPRADTSKRVFGAATGGSFAADGTLDYFKEAILQLKKDSLEKQVIFC